MKNIELPAACGSIFTKGVTSSTSNCAANYKNT